MGGGRGIEGRNSVLFLHCSRGLDITPATGNSGVAELVLDMGGWAVFSLMAELGPDLAQGASCAEVSSDLCSE